MKLLFGSVARVYVLRRGNSNRVDGFLLASNHISHFDPFIISSVVRRKIDWMAMAEFFPLPLLGFFLRAVDAFPAERNRADRKTIRTAIERLKHGRIVGLFPEGGIRDGARSLLEGAALRPGASTLAHIASVPILPCVIVGSDRLYSKKRWLPLRRTAIWIAFGEPIPHFPDLEKSAARACIEHELGSAFKLLYAELREKFLLTPDDLPHPPGERMKCCRASGRRGDLAVPGTGNRSGCPTIHRDGFRRFVASGVDLLMCASINLLQSRHHLHARSREEMEHYVTTCEKLTAEDYYAVPNSAEIATVIDDRPATIITWQSPIDTKFPANNIARADFFPCAQGWSAPTVLMLHALMSASHIGYRRYAARFNELGWNACFVHLPYHYSRVPRGHWNGELAITADLIRNAEGLRQGVIELRQLMAILRERGCTEFGVLGTSYGGWIGSLLAMVEGDFRFVALMAPIVNVEHAIWESPAARFMRRELQRANIEPSLIARHFHLSSPMHNQPLCDSDRVLFVAGEFDLIARPEDVEKIHENWRGSELLRVPQGHFGYRMLRETIARLKERGL
ncbi:MAG TPA: 1-acyl-sn-glycerol-3-phosphate acyltransferase [Candidatus Udaeobacter sp.]|nr:1-acyl-sn-glycerol-3-phosphate acyltransferase [Candidatus Udaeobacter sp.]